MMLLLLMLQLVCAVTGFTYLVASSDKTICVTNEQKVVAPMYDLDILPSTDLNWSSSWIKNWSHQGFKLDSSSTIYRDLYPTWHEYPRLVTSGRNDGFKRIFEWKNYTSNWNKISISILGESVSIMLAHDQAWEGKNRYIFDVDHFNKKTLTTQLRLRKCDKVDKICQTLFKQDISYLMQGKTWLHLMLDWEYDVNKIKFKVTEGEADTLILNCTDITEHLDGRLRFAFVKSYNKPAIFKLHLTLTLDTIDGKNNKLSSSFHLDHNGTICLRIFSTKWSKMKGRIIYEKASNAGVVFNSTINDFYYGSIKILSPGKYLVTISNVTNGIITNILSCIKYNGDLQIFKDIQKQIYGCQSFEKNLSAIYESKINALQKSVQMRAQDILNICSALGGRKNATCDTLKFCDKSGCFCISTPHHILTTSTISTNNEVEIMTKKCFPMAPSSLRVREIGNTWVSLAWDQHPEPNVTFELTYNHKDHMFKISQVKLIPHLIEGLSEGTEYQIEIRAANDVGLGMPSRILKIRTADIATTASTTVNYYNTDIWILSGSSILASTLVLIFGLAMLTCARRKPLPPVKDEHSEENIYDCIAMETVCECPGH